MRIRNFMSDIQSAGLSDQTTVGKDSDNDEDNLERQDELELESCEEKEEDINDTEDNSDDDAEESTDTDSNSQNNSDTELEDDGDLHEMNVAAFDPARKLEARKIAEEINAKVGISGVVYLSTIPTGMNVAKLREILSQYGEIGRIYLEPDLKGAQKRRKNTETLKHRQKYLEGWVEFANKKIAKRVAASLNSSPVGGKRRTPYYECLWSIKYLNRFKWSHLTEKLAHEKMTRQHRLRQEISQAKRQSNFYLQNVEKAKMLERIRKNREHEAQEFAPLRQFKIPQRLTDEEIRRKKSRSTVEKKKANLNQSGGLGSRIAKSIIANLFPGK